MEKCRTCQRRKVQRRMESKANANAPIHYLITSSVKTIVKERQLSDTFIVDLMGHEAWFTIYIGIIFRKLDRSFPPLPLDTDTILTRKVDVGFKKSAENFDTLYELCSLILGDKSLQSNSQFYSVYAITSRASNPPKTIAWFRLVLRIVRIGDFYDIPTSGILTTSGNTSFQTSQTVSEFYDVIGKQTVGDYYDVIGRIGSISTLKVLIPDIPDIGDFYDECEPGCPKNRNSRKNPNIGKS